MIPGVVLLLLATAIWIFKGAVPLENEELASLQERQEELQSKIRTLRGDVDEAGKDLLAVQHRLEAETAALQTLRNEDELLDYRLGALTKGEDGKLAAISRKQEQIDKVREHNQRLLARVLNENDPAKAIERVEKATIVILTDLGSAGSGFLCTPEGLAVTNYHVIAGSSELTLKMQKRDAREKVEIVGARIVAVDTKNDLAFIKMPAVPDTVAVEGKYPALPIRREVVRSGENVFAVGSPGLQNVLLEYTVTKGIISNPRRDIQGQPLMQTSCPVNPGNSGGPLCDSSGNVVGVVVSKGRFAEAVTFAIPTAQLLNLFASARQKPYAVPEVGGLAAWEKEHDPVAHMRRRVQAALAKRSIELPGLPTELVRAASGSTVYVVMGASGTVQEWDLAQRKVVNTYRFNGQITACAAYGQHVLVCDGQNRELHRLSRNGLKLIDKTPTRAAFEYLLPLGGASDYYLAYSEDAPPTLLSRNVWGRDLKQQIPFVGFPESFGAASNGRSLVLTGVPGKTTLSFSIVSLPVGIQNYATLYSYRQRPNISPRTISIFEQRLKAAVKRYSVASQASGLVLPTTLLCGHDRLISGRLVVRLGLRPRAEGLFEPSPYTRSNKPALRERRPFFMMMDSIVSVSANGRYAASGLGIYDVATRKLLKMLPLPSLMHIFSADGKHIYLASPTSNRLYTLDDWQQNAPDPDGDL